MLSNNLRRLTDIAIKTVPDTLNDAIAGKITLYTIIKKHITVFYDYVETGKAHDNEESSLIVAECDQHTNYERYDVVTLPGSALKELWVHGKLTGQQVDLIFSPPTPNHRISKPTHLDTIDLCDVYIDSSQIKNSKKQNKTGSHADYILAISESIKSLGKNATNEALYNWIKLHAANPPNHMQYYLNTLDFDEEDDISPFSVTSQSAVILKHNGKPITKKTFQNECSKAKK